MTFCEQVLQKKGQLIVLPLLRRPRGQALITI